MTHDERQMNRPERVRVDGKFFRLGPRKFHVKGTTYGPFAPNEKGEAFASPEQTASDFQLIKQLGVNVLRLYYVPPAWLLELAAERGLKLLIDIPWPKHLCFLDSKQSQTEARRAVREAVRSCRGHPAVFGWSVVNEISAEIVRWSGVRRVEKFIDELVAEAKAIDPDCLCTFTSFPPTEFLEPESPDFATFNVYLHQPKAFEGYLARLQTLAGAKPLVLGEFGMDSLREGEAAQAEFLGWQIETAFRAGLAGTVVFSFTDDWFRGGRQIEDWGFGLTTRERRPKNAFEVVRRQYELAPYFPLPRVAPVSVMVATYNGARTLENCLQSVTRLNYPDYEVILVDDGSVDATPEIASRFPTVRYLRQSNQGLAAARNTGIRAAKGEIVAFTDDDCRADEDWLYYLVSDLLRGDFAGIGGHNFLPPEDSSVAAAVVVSPGGPAHVMLTDREAEHVPGCNMAFFKSALEEIGLFDPIFRSAGDDVDVCWRLQDHDLKLGFSPAGFVWHYRRSTLRAYLKQQAGYGEAEALLMGKHPEHYNPFGGGLWRGRIYAPWFSGLLLRRAVIYHGVFGSGFFQRLYAPDPVQPLMLCTSLGYQVCVNLPLLLLAFYFDTFVPLALASVVVSVGACALAAVQANLPRSKHRFWSRPLVALLFFLQPIVRGWTRFKWRVNLLSGTTPVRLGPAALDQPPDELPEMVAYWSDGAVDRYRFLNGITSRLNQSGWSSKTDSGWSTYDLEIPAHLWTRLRLTTVGEELEQGRKTFRCRIRGFWSVPARIVFGALSVALCVLILTLARTTPWIWMSLIALPLAGWVFDEGRQEYERALAALIDGVAKEQALTKLE
ncbi:MAG: glycosyl transferase [Verrucomicrobia bacterium]|nr:MAG: glycosyl transferase [Verrucomicrobiota bacterium]